MPCNCDGMIEESLNDENLELKAQLDIVTKYLCSLLSYINDENPGIKPFYLSIYWEEMNFWYKSHCKRDNAFAKKEKLEKIKALESNLLLHQGSIKCSNDHISEIKKEIDALRLQL